MTKLKVMTIVGTRPEIIRLSRVIARLEEHTNHVLVHTGQNYDYELNQVFFDDLNLRQPDHFLDVDVSSLGTVLAGVLTGTERVLRDEQPDAVVVLGDTNSCIAALMAKRMRIPVYHMEAGNRSFDPNVPEEINRKLVDHIADYNLAYTEHSRRYLLAEGIAPDAIVVTGSPLLEVLSHAASRIDSSSILDSLGLAKGGYIVASIHREENVDLKSRLEAVVGSLNALAQEFGVRVLVSTHPRTRKRLARFGLSPDPAVELHSPMGFHDYISLQRNALCVVSDSGTIAEESAMLGFPAVTMRDQIERPEAFDTGTIITTGLAAKSVTSAVGQTISDFREYGPARPPRDYQTPDTSRIVVNYIRSTASTHHLRYGIRTGRTV